MGIFAEALGALALVINFIGYRQNDMNRYRIISAVALAVVSTHFFLLGAMAAGIGCGLASLRNIVALRYRRSEVVLLFVAVNLGFLFYEWFALQHAWIIAIAYTSSLVFTIGSFVLKSATRIRQWFILAELLGLTYAILVGSIFGSIFNISNLVSIFIKLKQDYRHKKTD
ncbi:YgjV family protein [Alteromonas sp. 5E99-2]|uniref:YgjV family protein n=1 Tax=Alteromonas sp. 5E99-2 TaxID=2817683 RepID=UPI001A9A1D02|nr:YgjV family protein [Alteromonas sp. 5E99-2]MBO1254524.1 YgjV family protein [Alteromonas sp. 5E99-2]